jgi:orotate phosphoribosyltransferase
MHASYLSALTPKQFKKTVQSMAALIRLHFPKVNILIGRGLSGSMLIPALAVELECDWAIQRKGENNHSCFTIEISELPETARAVFVDDLIDSGETFAKVCEAFVRKALPKVSCEIVGAALYSDYSAKGGGVMEFEGREIPVKSI